MTFPTQQDPRPKETRSPMSVDKPRFRSFTDTEIQELEAALSGGETAKPGVCVQLVSELVAEARVRGLPLLKAQSPAA
jgi:hypothetical protein